MIHVLRFARGLAAATAIAISAVHAQTGQLNDTGMTQCLRTGTSGPTACTGASLANDGDLPHQDARYGRDVANPPKVGGGAAGFDFTRICWNGSPEGTASGPNLCTGTLVANTTATASATPATDWACTRDNVTGLLWSLQTQTASWNAATDATYADAGHNTPARCGSCFVQCVAPNTECLLENGNFVCKPPCTPPLEPCNGICVDKMVDPFNCGVCNKVCPALICAGGICQGTNPGHEIVVGHDRLPRLRQLHPATLTAVGRTLPAGGGPRPPGRR